mgnify:CR=1 FL=1
MPGYYGVEAGQSAVGDLLRWWVEVVCEGNESTHAALTSEAAALAPGASGLVALDWNNGNRTILVDPRLTGLIVGQTLHTTRAEIYRALIEAAQQQMTRVSDTKYMPNPAAQKIYDELYGLYRELHDSFGGVPGARADFPTLMKRLLAIRERATGGHA